MLPDASAPGADLVVRGALPDVVTAVRERGTAVLVAPPGSGKTSLLPLALADALDGRVIVAEPRRIATRAAAMRLAMLVGEIPGQRIGYAMRGQRAGGTDVRVEVVTTGLLVQRLQHDPDLPGVGAVVIDECHERHLDADLALAFCVDVRATLREDLALVATSATPDTGRVAAALAGAATPAPVVTAASVSHPVEVVWAAPDRPLPLLADARVDPRLLEHVAAVVRRALVEAEGDVLVFLPGEAEIGTVSRRLHGAVDVVPLFGRQSGPDQDRALRPGPRRRAVLTTAVAESSLTVPGVRIVVDAGLSRQPRTDHARGLGALVTTRVSKASADQRAGRAGREGAGRVYRCWSETDHTHLDAHATPEIATADLAGFALALAAWGTPGGAGLALLEQPPAAAMSAADRLLRGLDAVDEAGRITARGRRMAAIGAHPRLARAVLDGAAAVGGERAREIVALLSDETLNGRDDDLPARWRALRDGTGGAERTGAADRDAAARWRQEVRRLGRGGPRRTALSDDLAVGTVVGLAYPDRLARARRPGSHSYLMAGGTGGALDPASGLRGTEWIAVAAADRPVGRADARIRSAAPLDEAAARSVGAGLLTRTDEISWAGGELVLRRTEALGAIELSAAPLRDPDPARVAKAVRDGLRTAGLGILRWTRDAEQLRQRLAFCHAHLGTPWPAVDDDALLADVERWLAPELVRVRRTRDLARIDAGAALRRLLPWPAAAQFDQLAPTHLEVPTGSRVRLDYEGARPPKLAVRVQEAFGWTATPSVAGGRVPVVLHLLSPAGHPVAVTSDLASFWQQGYPQVRADLRGRYPRHPWPENPLLAEPTRRANPRRR
jgi:ATP-dependent helicase HrpB